MTLIMNPVRSNFHNFISCPLRSVPTTARCSYSHFPRSYYHSSSHW